MSTKGNNGPVNFTTFFIKVTFYLINSKIPMVLYHTKKLLHWKRNHQENKKAAN